MRARQASNEKDEATGAQRGWPSRRFRMEKRRASNGKEGLKIEKNKGKAQYAKA